MKEIKAYRTKFGGIYETKEKAQQEEEKQKKKEYRKTFEKQAWTIIETYMQIYVKGETGIRKPHLFFANELIKHPELVKNLCQDLLTLKENIFEND